MEKLERTIKGKNLLNQYATELITSILPQLTQYVGKKIFNVTGDKAKSFVIELDKIKPVSINEATGHYVRIHRCYLKESYGRLELNLSICLNGGSYEHRTAYTEYFEMNYQIGKVNNSGILEGISSLHDISFGHGLGNVIDIEVEKAKIAKLKDLENQLDEVKATIQVDREVYKYM